MGSNFDGDLAIAKRYIRELADVGADAAKFQTLTRGTLMSPLVWSGGEARPNERFDAFANLELAPEWHVELKRAADEAGIDFLSTPFFLEAVDLLEDVGVRSYKIASGDITFTPLLKRVAATGKKTYLSTGASTLEDVASAIETLRSGGTSEIFILHCASLYPPRWGEVNLRAMETLSAEFGLPVGISDHTPGTTVPLGAVALGASVVEKHVTFDRELPGPDHPFALTMAEFGEMVAQVRRLEDALGSAEKAPVPREIEKLPWLRRGTYDPSTHRPSTEHDAVWLRPQTPQAAD